MSGRVIDFAVDPAGRSTWYFVAASRRGLEDRQRRHHLDADLRQRRLVLDRLRDDRPEEPDLVVWVGTGENNSQRSVGYGDGVYKSIDGGKSWRTSGSRSPSTSARSSIDPRDSNVVYVAAQGPLWAAGRRPRPVQDHRRRQDLESRPHHQREHRRHRRRLRPAQPGRALRRAPTSAAGTSGPYRRRPRVAPSTDRPTAARRWTKINERTARRRHGPHRPGDRARSTPTSSTPSSRRPTRQGGFFRSDDRRRDLEEAIGVSRDQPAVLPQIVVDPKNVDRIYAMDTSASRSPTTAARRSARSARSGSTSTTTPSGSTRATRTT